MIDMIFSFDGMTRLHRYEHMVDLQRVIANTQLRYSTYYRLKHPRYCDRASIVAT